MLAFRTLLPSRPSPSPILRHASAAAFSTRRTDRPSRAPPNTTNRPGRPNNKPRSQTLHNGLRPSYPTYTSSPVPSHPLAATGGPFNLLTCLHPRTPSDIKAFTFPGLSCYCLGTSSGMPSHWRNTSSYAIRLGAATTIVDCGESTQLQLMRSSGSIVPTDIQRICITHLHGDHLFGLQGLVLHLNQSHSQTEKQVMKHRDGDRQGEPLHWSLEPKAKSQEPRAKSQEPRAKSQEPRAKSQEPRAKSQEPRESHCIVTFRSPLFHCYALTPPASPSPLRLIEIIGPPGLYNYLSTTLKLSYSHISKIQVVVKELHFNPKRKSQEPQPRYHSHENHPDNKSNVWNIANKDYSIPNLTLEKVYEDAPHSGVWDLTTPDSLANYASTGRPLNDKLVRGYDEWKGLETTTKEEDMQDFLQWFQTKHTSPDSDDLHTLLENFQWRSLLTKEGERPVTLKAGIVKHVKGVTTFGYTMQEGRVPRRINVERVKHFGIKLGRKVQRIKAGLSVHTDGPDPVFIDPETCYLDKVAGTRATATGGRKVTILGDNKGVSEGMKRIMHGSDLLVCEATLGDDHAREARERAHQVPSGAVNLAIDTECRGTLLLTHLSQRYNDEGLGMKRSSNGRPFTGPFSQVAQKTLHAHNKAQITARNKLEMVVACDFMEVMVPHVEMDIIVPEDGVGVKVAEAEIKKMAVEREDVGLKIRKGLREVNLEADENGTVYDMSIRNEREEFRRVQFENRNVN